MIDKNNFYIDTHEGVLCHLTVNDKGLIVGVTNQENPVAKKIYETYKNKSISFFVKDFTERMKPAWYIVKSTDWTNYLLEVEALESNIKFYNGALINKSIVSDRLDREDTDLTAEINTIREKLSKYNARLYHLRDNGVYLKNEIVRKFNFKIK